MKGLLQSLSFLVGAVLLILFGMAVPVQFQSVDVDLLREAGKGTESLQDRIRYLLDNAKPGPAEILDGSLASAGSEVEPFDQEIRSLLESDPAFAVTGGQAPYFLDFLKSSGITIPSGENANPDASQGAESGEASASSTKRIPVADFIISQNTRAKLLFYLRASHNAIVKAILASRDMKGLTRFEPVSSSAGAPLDASLLVAGMLAQGGYLKPDLSGALQNNSVAAINNDLHAVRKLENFYLSLLFLANRLNYLQLAEFVKQVPDMETLEELVNAMQKAPEKFGLIYTAAVFSGQPGEVVAYLKTPEIPQEAAFTAFTETMPLGKGALNELLRLNKPIYQQPQSLKSLDPMVKTIQHASGGARLAATRLGVAYVVKFIAFFLAGFLLMKTVERYIRNLVRSHAEPGHAFSLTAVDPTRNQSAVLVILRNSLGGFAFAVVLWAALEPSLLSGSQAAPVQSGPSGNLLSNTPITFSTTAPMNAQSTDPITMLVLFSFFLVQLFVYVAGLIKLSEIRRADADPELKLDLLANEDSFFDTGLYVGLGGTVLALIMATMGIVQASLMAAYASTFFGIIFVAVLKIIHVRPLRKQLLIEAQEE